MNECPQVTILKLRERVAVLESALTEAAGLIEEWGGLRIPVLPDQARLGWRCSESAGSAEGGFI